jgi:predicted MFS family arabinose efflux permease
VVLVSVVALAVVAYTVPAGVVEYAMAGSWFSPAPAPASSSRRTRRSPSPRSPRARGLAGSVGQLGQRVGTAVGTAIGLSLFYSTVYRENGAGDALAVFHDAYAYGMVAVGVFLGIALLLIGVIDLGARRRAAQD